MEKKKARCCFLFTVICISVLIHSALSILGAIYSPFPRPFVSGFEDEQNFLSSSNNDKTTTTTTHTTTSTTTSLLSYSYYRDHHSYYDYYYYYDYVITNTTTPTTTTTATRISTITTTSSLSDVAICSCSRENCAIHWRLRLRTTGADASQATITEPTTNTTTTIPTTTSPTTTTATHYDCYYHHYHNTNHYYRIPATTTPLHHNINHNTTTRPTPPTTTRIATPTSTAPSACYFLPCLCPSSFLSYPPLLPSSLTPPVVPLLLRHPSTFLLSLFLPPSLLVPFSFRCRLTPYSYASHWHCPVLLPSLQRHLTALIAVCPIYPLRIPLLIVLFPCFFVRS